MTIWNLGSINLDLVYRLDHLPQPGETLAALRHDEGLGGKGANQSVAAARAGSETRHVGAMGEGSPWVLDQLIEAGVETTGIVQSADHATGHAVILVDRHAENCIVIHPGANRALDGERVADALSWIDPEDTLLIQNETNLQVEAAQIARAAGARVIYSAAPFDLDAVQAILPFVSILALNRGEADRLFAAMDGDLPVDALLITLGGDGAEYRDLVSGETLRQRAFPVAAVDTTGAGDCFAGYFAAGLDQGMAPSEALRLAAAAAALAVTRPGAGGAIPALAEVEAFLARHG